MAEIKNIKELLGINVEFLYENSVLKSDLTANQSDFRNFLLFDLKSSFLRIFTQFQVSMFDGKAVHLEFRALNPNQKKVKKLVELIINEYGDDENGLGLKDWDAVKYLSWWFKNDKHQQVFDDYDCSEKLFYGIMIEEIDGNQIVFSILNYFNIDSCFKY